MKIFSACNLFLPAFAAAVVVGAARGQSAVVEAGSITLPALVSEIATGHPELKFHEAEVAAAAAAIRSASALPVPELSVELGRKRLKDSTGALVGEGATWSVSVTQAFEWPGRVALRKAIANRQVELAELGLDRFRAALDARARTLAYGLYSANAKSAAVREVADRFAALKETFLGREPAGITPLLETRVIEASELSLQRRAAEAELALQAVLLELNQLRGAAPDAPLRVTAPALRFNDPPVTAALLIAARENNFDFRMRRAELEQQGYQVRLARNERNPTISVSPFYSQEKAGERETTVGIGVSMPLPITNRTRGAVDVAEARHRQAATSVLIAQREVEREVLIAAQAFATKVAEVRRWPADSVLKFREAAALADRHYRLGAVPIATYVELQNSYLEAVEALLDTERETLAAGLKLQQLTGLDFNAVQTLP